MTTQLTQDLAALRQWLDGIIELADKLPVPWKAPALWDESGLVKNKVIHDCQPGKHWKADTATICELPEEITINRPIGEFIAQSRTIIPLMARMLKTCLDALEDAYNEGGDIGWLESLITQWKEATK